MNDLRIDMTDNGRGTVYLNGDELKMVTAVDFHAAVDQANRALISILVNRAVICAPVEVERRTTVLLAPSYFEYWEQRTRRGRAVA